MKEIGIVLILVIIGGSIFYFSENKNSRKEIGVFNQGSGEYAVMGREFWSAFRCSAWASQNNNKKEAERLFLFGYEQGKTFLSALSAGKIKAEDVSREVPIGVTMSLQGPNEEFILGRLQSFAEEDALEEVFKTGDKFNSEELQKSIAGNKFQDGNCQLIGR